MGCDGFTCKSVFICCIFEQIFFSDLHSHDALVLKIKYVKERFQYRVAIRSVVIYLILSILWIVLSDLLLRLLPLTNEQLWKFETMKGLIFVILSTLMLYFFVLSAAKEQKKILGELTQSEIQFRRTLDGMLEGCQIIGFDWTYLYLNDAAAVHGKRSKEELIGKKITDAYPGIDQTEVFQVMKKCMEERVSHEMENEFVYPDGSKAWFELRIQPAQEGIFILSVDITARKLHEAELNASREQLHALTGYLQSSIEEERARISREIHDDIGQRMTALRMDLSMLQKSLSQHPESPLRESALQELPQMQKMIDDSIAAMRKIIRDLRPEVLDTLGLMDGLRWQTDEFQKRSGINCRLTLPNVNLTFNSEITTALFRILQESLSNVARHSQASEVDVSLSLRQDVLTLTVVDNGKGISDEEIKKVESFGLLGIRERVRSIGGEVVIEGKKGEGTRVHVAVPFKTS